jgi:hypothetical protein
LKGTDPDKGEREKYEEDSQRIKSDSKGECKRKERGPSQKWRLVMIEE